MYEKLNDYDVTFESYNSLNKKLHSLEEKIKQKRCFLGFDGYVDSLYSIVKTREDAQHWTRMDSMKTFGELIASVAGSSANIERVLKRRISGGFAPNSCKAISSLGMHVTLVGALGYPIIDDTFKPLVDSPIIDVISFANPGETAGLEFDDGKIMLTDFENILGINWDLIVERVGLDKLIEIFKNSDVLGFGHWSLIPNMGDIWTHLVEEIFPSLNSKDLKRKLFFVDLADIKKRTKKDILYMLEQLGEIDNYLHVMLSLNDQEAIDISKALDDVKDIDPTRENFADYIEGGKNINEKVNISYLIIHSPHFATISTKDNHFWVTEGFTSKPRFTTGAGDHFHSGAAVGLICDLTPPESILLGNALTAVFVRTGSSPDFKTLSQFIAKYMYYIENDDPNFS
ncbi:MAG: hypothetical protein ACTSQP_19905 [Promethearchaeota archaeon]